MKNTICKYPFSSIAIKEYNSKGELTTFWPCCMMGNQTLEEVKQRKLNTKRLESLPGEDINELTPLEISNHPSMEKLRNNLKNGIRDSACNVCWEMEDRGILSFREKAIQFLDPEEIIKEVKLETIDMSINNKCNLRCRMCSPTASSLLSIDHKYFAENNLLGELKNTAVRWGTSDNGAFKLSTNKQWQWIINNTDKFKRLRLSGGEPFDNDDVIKFIDKAIADGTAKDITLEFHTNGLLVDDTMIEKLSHFSNNLNFSIDGTDKVYEFIRYPGKWDVLDSNMKSYIKKITHGYINMAFIMMITNVFNLPKFIKWADTLNQFGITGEPRISLSCAEVHSQDRGISLRNLSIELLEEAYAEIEVAIKAHPTVGGCDALSIIKDSIINNTGDKAKALGELELFDRARNQNFRDYLDPRIINWLDN
jgi:sulfatase maturation enzyme AslB (radical SAM superfamily)